MKKAFEFIILFLILSISLYFLCTGFLGEKGFLYNQSLKQLLAEMELKAKKAEFELDNLKRYERTLSSKEGVRDTAIELGYYLNGDKIYLIQNGQLQDSIKVEELSQGVTLFKCLSKMTCLIISCSVSLFICLVSLIINEYKTKAIPEIEDKEYKYNNNDLIE